MKKVMVIYSYGKDWHSLDTIDMLLECFEGMI